MNITKGSIAVTVLLLAAGGEAQEKKAVALPKSPEVAQKAAGTTAAGSDRKSIAATSEPPVAGATSGANNTNPVKAVPAGSTETPEVKAGQSGSGARPGLAIRRDPFRPFTLNLRSAARRRDNLSPLERYELGQLKLVGIIWNIKNPTALVEDTSGLGYTVRVGTPIGANDGKVKTIRPDALLIEEEYIDLYGAKKKREVSMRLAAEKSE
jgi:type IV pilus assembly protein PilP